ncbi:MAG: rod shape-determining protein MreD [Alcanivoracaceae bacterium]|nr:rod shape-determining protein MreD [Alcanivoracaceae bacterium]
MKHYSGKLIHLSIISCLILMLIPWHAWVKTIQPYWLALAIIYWSIEAPKQCGLFTAFFYSILLDVLYGSLFGKHGFSMVAMVFIISKIHKRLKMTSFWQLALMIGALLLNDALIRAVIDWLSSNNGFLNINFWQVLSSIFLWPWFKYFLDRMRQKY